MKLRGTSTMETIMSIVLSGVVIIFISSSYQYVLRAYKMFQEENTTLNELVLFNHAMQQSFVRSKKVYANDNLVCCDLGNRKINYLLSENFIIRSEANNTDTFNIKINQTIFYLNGEILKNKPGIIDALKINADADSEKQLLFFTKEYSSELLMEADESNITNNGI